MTDSHDAPTYRQDTDPATASSWESRAGGIPSRRPWLNGLAHLELEIVINGRNGGIGIIGVIVIVVVILFLVGVIKI